MAESNWMRHSLRLGLVGIRRSLRNLRRNRLLGLLYGFSFVCFALGFAVMSPFVAAVLRRASTPVVVPTNLRVAVVFAWVLVGWMVARRVVLFKDRPDNGSFVLTTVSARTVIASQVVAECCLWCLVVALPTVTFVGIVGYAFSQPASLVLIPIAAVLFVASAVVFGFVFGFGYFAIVVRSPTIRRTDFTPAIQLLLRILGPVVILATVTDGIVPGISFPAGTFERVPTSWFVDLAALGTPTTVSVGRAVGIALATAVVVAVGGAVVERLATAYWYDSSDTAAHEITESRTGDDTALEPKADALAAALSPVIVPRFVNTPTRRVAQMAVLRLRRAPRRLSFLVGPAATFVVVSLARTPHPVRFLPVVCAVALPWLAGAAFGLNPLGDAGAVLPTLLTSVPGREFVRGLAVPGLAYGLPLTIACTLVTGVFGPYSVAELAGLVAVGAVLTAVAVVLAPAIGMGLPRFDALVLGQRSGVLPPSLSALAVYSISMSVLGGIAMLLLFPSATMVRLPVSFGVSLDLFRLGGVMCVLAAALAVGAFSYRSAVSRFTATTVE